MPSFVLIVLSFAAGARIKLQATTSDTSLAVDKVAGRVEELAPVVGACRIIFSVRTDSRVSRATA